MKSGLFDNITDVIRNITVDQLLHFKEPILLDVRSPGEFTKGHVPNAVNLPLFSDEERAVIGTLYKESGPDAAFMEGLSIIQAKLVSLVTDAKIISGGKEIIIHCWRGGKRSESVAWLLDKSGLQVSVLQGGYKSYRQYVQEFFENSHHQLVVLGGRTGCSKTAILKLLKASGEHVIDLEQLAHHKGSAFGWIGEERQLPNEQFENSLFQKLLEIKESNKLVWVENESRTIGSNYIPEAFWRRMKKSPLINIQRNLSLRISQLVESYNSTVAEDLIHSFRKIETRIGHEATQIAIEMIQNSNFEKAAEIALKYYDKCYDYNLKNNKSDFIVNFDFEDKALEVITSELIQWSQKNIN